MLVITATNAMLSMEQSPRAKVDWEELDVGKRTWTKWKTTYRAAAKNATIKKKANGGKEQFGAAHIETPQPARPGTIQPKGSLARESHTMSLEAINGYFNKLVAAATNKKLVLEDLVVNLTTLTTRNVEMADTIEKLTGENRQLQKQLNSFQKKLPPDELRGATRHQPVVGRDTKLWLKYKQEVWYKPDDCFEIYKNYV